MGLDVQLDDECTEWRQTIALHRQTIGSRVNGPLSGSGGKGKCVYDWQIKYVVKKDVIHWKAFVLSGSFNSDRKCMICEKSSDWKWWTPYMQFCQKGSQLCDVKFKMAFAMSNTTPTENNRLGIRNTISQTLLHKINTKPCRWSILKM